MDANKLKTLKEIGYEIPPCCGLCKHSKFNEGSNFGVCSQYSYNHLKHTDKPRELSVHKYGKCKNYSLSPERTNELHRFVELMK